MDQWQPTLYENHELVPRSKDPNYILTPDLVDHAIAWLRRTRSHRGRQAVLPLHVDRRDARAAPGLAGVHREVSRASSTWAGTCIASRRSRGRRSWASCRRTRKLTKRPEELPAWDSLSADQKRLFARMMEVFAAFTDQTDYEMGRLLDVGALAAGRRQHDHLLRGRRQRRVGRRRAGRPARTRTRSSTTCRSRSRTISSTWTSSAGRSTSITSRPAGPGR